MEGRSHGHKPLEEGFTPGTEDKTPPIRGIGLRVTNIEGNNLFPRRGMYSTNHNSVIDGLFEISKPVEVNLGSAGEGSVRAAMHDSHANPSSTAEKGFMDNQGNNDPRGSKFEKNSNVQGQSYAEKLASTQPTQKVNFRFLENSKAVEGVEADVTIPIASVKQVQDRFQNVLFGYFLGKRLAFPVVDYFVSHRWDKYGLQKCMMNGKGFFFFKFTTKEGMEQVLQDGPWLIRNIPIFLKHWSPNTELKKEELKKIPVWVKMHDVPLATYTEDGLSLIASKVGTPKVLDNETTKMCLDSWGRSSYARAIVELDAEKDLKNNVTVAIPNVEDGGFIKSIIRVEYEWKPPRCDSCNVFGHGAEDCPTYVLKKPDKDVNAKDNGEDQGFKNGNTRRKGAKNQFNVKDRQRFIYWPKKPTETIEKQPEKVDAVKPKSANRSQIHTSNAFDALNDVDEEWAADPEEVLAILESHVKVANLDSVCKNVFRSWDWTSNGSLCNKGTRIVLGWNGDNVDVMVVHATDQVIHAQVMFKKDQSMSNVSFIYASNSDQERKELWESLRMHKGMVRSNPWIIMGDFNVVLNLEDKCFGSSTLTAAMKDFNNCVNDIEVFDAGAHGMHFTWNQRPKHGVGLRKKLDRIMVNVSFVDTFVDAYSVFLPNGISDHCPGVLKIRMAARNKPKPFKFPNFLTHKKEFMEVVNSGWAEDVMGVPMFRVVKKLKGLKHPFRLLLRNQGNLHQKVIKLKAELDKLQSALDGDPFNVGIKEAEGICQKKYLEASLDEERFLKQKAKQKWLEAGDSNTAFFHNMVKCRNHVNKINVIKDTTG
ncbi:uncharacterized protein LOC110870633 [Helianthus annuus]|uniref:uncharacterized protein LOC110870633 n=1 Tax=Helianthus annuus TaxID=4232 RepID=UPI000B8F6283|nr:uncharacterized protein LOC110870633 [Helianthus annuus]